MVEITNKHVEQLLVPALCFAAIFLMHVRYLRTWLAPSVWADPHALVDISTVHNLRTFFVGIRTRWVLENHGRNAVAVQTMRDMISITTSIASASMAFISIFIGLSKTNLVNLDLLNCPETDGTGCSSFEERLRFARFGLCIANFVCIFFNMLLATRYAINTSFMLNTKEVDGKPLSQMLTVNVLARASWHYTLGVRGFFLAAPLVAWLFGSWMLLGTTVLYLLGVYMMEEDFLLTEEVWEPLPGEDTHTHTHTQTHAQAYAQAHAHTAVHVQGGGGIGGGGKGKGDDIHTHTHIQGQEAGGGKGEGEVEMPPLALETHTHTHTTDSSQRRRAPSKEEEVLLRRV